MSKTTSRLPMRAYKYMEARFATVLVNQGRIRINTLHNFQAIEKHGPEIGDQDEGVLVTHMGGDTIDPREPSSLNPSIKRLIDSGRLIIGDGSSIRIMEDLIERTADCFIYCASLVADANLMSRMSPQYEVCVEISDLPKFASILTASMRASGLTVENPVITPVTYAARRAHHTEQATVHPAFLKDPAYEYQQEIRVLWPTDESPGGPVDLEASDIRPLMKVIALQTGAQ